MEFITIDFNIIKLRYNIKINGDNTINKPFKILLDLE